LTLAGGRRERFIPQRFQRRVNARYLISGAYCRIHQKIDIASLSERFNLSQAGGEKWIVNLIRERWMGADAKIDLEKVCFLAFFSLSSFRCFLFVVVMLTF